ncbi:hypothetical protein ABT009_42050 [Streptomyces sp. NPDC002896]|uniref:hypothetical protein n=1 Tax=Streptomyces sp. NPDC002896 TaxID=3154438 RepID=UPI00331856BD
MFLVVPDPAHGLVAAPESSLALTPDSERLLSIEGFAWNGEIEAFTRQCDNIPAAVDRTSALLRELGHYVLASWTPLPHAKAT